MPRLVPGLGFKRAAPAGTGVTPSVRDQLAFRDHQRGLRERDLGFKFLDDVFSGRLRLVELATMPPPVLARPPLP